jgi:hypothetical protein
VPARVEAGEEGDVEQGALFRGEAHVGGRERRQLLARVVARRQGGAVTPLLLLVALEGQRSQQRVPVGEVW